MYNYQDIKDIKVEGDYIGTVMYKPMFQIYFMLVCAIGIIFVNSWAAKILGAFVALVALFVIFKVKDKKTIDVYTKCILIYDVDGNKAVMIKNEDIKNYDTGSTEQYKLFVKLYDGRSLTKETFRLGDAKKYLAKTMPKKTTLEVRQEENKNKSFDIVKGFKKMFGLNTKKENKVDIKRSYLDALDKRLDDVFALQHDKIVKVANMFGDCMENKGVVQLFGVKHAVEFVNELNYRAGGIAQYHKIGLNDLMLRKELSKDADFITGEAYKNIKLIDRFYEIYQMDDRDMFVFVSERGDEPIVIEWAKRIKAKGQKIVAVVNKKTYDKVGGTLLDYADLWLDMMADEVDTALNIGDLKIGQLGSTTADIIAQMITAELYRYYVEKGKPVPVLLSANVKGSDVHNNALTDPFERRIRLWLIHLHIKTQYLSY